MTANPRSGASDPFEVLGISPEAGPDEIQEAYLLLVATYGEGSYAPYPVLPKEKRKAVLREIEKAYRTLKQRPAPVASTPAAAESSSVSDQRDNKRPAAQPVTLWDRLTVPIRRFLTMSSGPSSRPAPDARRDRKLAGEYRLSPGRYLKNVRTQKSLSLESISKETNIQIQYLRALEEENYEELPAGVYRRLMLSAYAKCLDLEPEALVKDLPE